MLSYGGAAHNVDLQESRQCFVPASWQMSLLRLLSSQYCIHFFCMHVAQIPQSHVSCIGCSLLVHSVNVSLFLSTNAASDWIQEVHAKGNCEVNMCPPCIDEHHITVYVIHTCTGKAWAMWRDSVPNSLRDRSSVHS